MKDSVDVSQLPVQLSQELSIPLRGVVATLALLDDGATIPFIARYRKEATGSLDEVQLRALAERREYLVALAERKAAVRDSIESQGKLTADLAAAIDACATKVELEDLYLPYRPKRRTRAMMAIERGLMPLAEAILAQPATGRPSELGQQLVDGGAEVASVGEALAGARDIVAEVIAERADVRALVRQAFHRDGIVRSEVVKAKANERTKFEQYYDFAEPLAKIASHRFMAIRRGEAEGVLRARVSADLDPVSASLRPMVGVSATSPFRREFELAIDDSLARLLAPSLENELRVELKLRADDEALGVFADNLGNLLLAAPLGGASVVGIDPGFRTGCKIAAVDATGRFLDHLTIYLSSGEAATARARGELTAFLAKHKPRAIAIGNGTGGRETSAFVRELLAESGGDGPFVLMVNEAGASVYSASELAREEFPELDLTIRGAISIARRLQDPLAELVKIDPKAIGVGQYQHDVDQSKLGRRLGEVVESCVNRVGVELNTASAALLTYVAGLGPAVAKKIVAHRDKHGAFPGRAALLAVSGLGPKAFEQCAGFLRVQDGAHPLDASAVHPERYPIVEEMAADLELPLAAVIGNQDAIRRLNLAKYERADVGAPTLRDIVDELRKPGRDPRASFEAPTFRDDVQSMNDLKVDMKLTGVVTNVTAFGAFVDVGVHQDGLVHISQLADQFVKNPSDVVKVGDKLSVRVLEVDLERKRIALSARSTPSATETAEAAPANLRGPQSASRGTKTGRSSPQLSSGPSAARTAGKTGAKGPDSSGRQSKGKQSSSDRPSGVSRFVNNPFAALAGTRDDD